MKLLIATYNHGKIRELKKLLADLPFEIKGLHDYENIADVEETGLTFAENAALKAREYALATKTLAVADDSGLEVNALGGAPGVFSARFAGEGASDRQKIEKLLQAIENTQDNNRSARFVCAMAIADESGKVVFTAEGICTGRIVSEPGGDNGFGYDPVFLPDGFAQTFGELADEIKQKISHRARAAAKINRYLRDFIVV